jgi:hypothetical protein
MSPPPDLHPGDLTMLGLWRAHRTGLAPYYPLLYSLVIGMGARRAFEFGMGESTVTLLDALVQTNGILVSCSPDAAQPPREHPNFIPLAMTSEEALKQLGPSVAFDLVLHDGSHSANVVAADLIGILPRVKQGGLVLIHDTLHSYVGAQMREGLFRGRDGRRGEAPATAEITLPFAFGLTIWQVTGNAHLGPVSIGAEKATSPHHTEPYSVMDASLELRPLLDTRR